MAQHCPQELCSRRTTHLETPLEGCWERGQHRRTALLPFSAVLTNQRENGQLEEG